MKLFSVFALLIAIVAVVFALQNPTPVLVQFFGWQTVGSMALVLMITFTLGVAFGLLISVPPMLRRMKTIAQLKRQMHDQSHDLEAVNHQLIDARTQITASQATPPPAGSIYPPESL